MIRPRGVDLMPESKYLRIDEIHFTGKTFIWAITSRSSGVRLGRICWHGPWRQYCFQPDANTIWNDGCLADIQTFIRTQMSLRRANSAERST